MKLITRDTDYALRAACFIAKAEGRVVAVTELVQKLKIPRPFLRKILQMLSRKGILSSLKGPAGGFILAKPAGKVLLVDLIRIFQGPLRLNECFFRKMKCPNTSSCPLKKKIDRIEKYVINELQSITMASLLKEKI